MKKNFTVLILFLSCVFFSEKTYAAETPWSGNIASNTTWTSLNSPYVITGTIQIYPGARLTIEPGVTIKFNPNAALKVGGVLKAIGTTDNNISFTSNQAAPQEGDWSGIEFTDLASGAKIDNNTNYISGSIFKYCTIEYASNYAIQATNAPYLDSNLIQDNHGGVYFSCPPASSTAVIKNSVIKNNKSSGGLTIIGGTTIIKNNQILNNAAYTEGGGLKIAFSNAIITGNNIEGNSNDNYGGGIFIYGSSNVNIFNNIIKNNFSALGTAIYMGSYGKININYNTITENYPSDLTLGSAVFCSDEGLNVSNFRLDFCMETDPVFAL
ncbi:MAG: right-handed parallel beta-helix repeat-containing protein, partial [Pseudomonadota bacterium]